MRSFGNSYELPIIPDVVARDNQGNILIDPVTGLNQLETHFLTYGDHGRVQAYRLPFILQGFWAWFKCSRTHLENPLDPANNVIWDRDIFKRPTAIELNRTVWSVNLMDRAQTGLPALTLEDLTGIAAGEQHTYFLSFKLAFKQFLGHYVVELARGYQTDIQVIWPHNSMWHSSP